MVFWRATDCARVRWNYRSSESDTLKRTVVTRNETRIDPAVSLRRPRHLPLRARRHRLLRHAHAARPRPRASHSVERGRGRVERALRDRVRRHDPPSQVHHQQTLQGLHAALGHVGLVQLVRGRLHRVPRVAGPRNLLPGLLRPGERPLYRRRSVEISVGVFESGGDGVGR